MKTIDLVLQNNRDGTFTLSFPTGFRVLDLTKLGDLEELQNAIKQINKMLKERIKSQSKLPPNISDDYFIGVLP